MIIHPLHCTARVAKEKKSISLRNSIYKSQNSGITVLIVNLDRELFSLSLLLCHMHEITQTTCNKLYESLEEFKMQQAFIKHTYPALHNKMDTQVYTQTRI